MTNQPLSSTLEDNRFNRFDDELIDTYFNEAGKQAIRDYIANQVKADTPISTDDELDEILLQFWRAARLRNDTTPPEEYHSKAKQAILAHQEKAAQEARLQLKVNVWQQFKVAMTAQDLSPRPTEGSRFRTPLEELTLILEREVPIAELTSKERNDG